MPEPTFLDTPPEVYNNPYIDFNPIYTDVDFFVNFDSSKNIYINNVKQPELTLEHCTAYFIQSSINSFPIKLGLNKDINDDSLNSFLSFYVTGTKVDNFNEYTQKFKPSDLTYIKLNCTYKIPSTAIYYFYPNLPNKGNKINVLATENFTSFTLLTSCKFLVLSADDYEFYFGNYKNNEVMVNVRSEYTGSTLQLPSVTSYRLPLSSYFTVNSLDDQNKYVISYNFNYVSLSAKVITFTKF